MKHWLLAAAVLSLSACAQDVLNTQPEVRGLEGAAPVQTLTNPSTGTDINIRRGGTVVVRLESNPTTGYFWYLLDGTDESIITLVSEDYVADPAPEGLVGSGGMQVFTFEGAGRGSTVLNLSYQRHEADVAETLMLNVNARR
ncbi:MAG: protease inhibitor I42 family protein [Henriciella sp.]|nr:protease inhibitor I42 family protein [Henriciella sp.]